VQLARLWGVCLRSLRWPRRVQDNGLPPPCTRCGSRRVTLEGEIYGRRTRGSRRSAHHRRDRLHPGDGWCPSSKARASGFAVSPVARPRSRHACRRRRKWSQVISSIRGHSIAPSRESPWPITSCTPWPDTATTSKRIYWYVLLPVHTVIFGGMLREIARRAQAGRD
jgi:hypothetical protein